MGNAVVGITGGGGGAPQHGDVPAGIVFHAGGQTVRAVKIVVYGGKVSHCVQVRGAAAQQDVCPVPQVHTAYSVNVIYVVNIL